MSTGAFGSNDTPRPVELEQPTASESEQAVRRQLLDQVMQETLSLLASDEEPLRQEDLDALVAVVVRHGTPLTADAATDLVRCLLQMRQKGLAQNPDYFEKLAKDIARTLLDDPPTAQRLSRLWDRLCVAAN